MVTKGVACSRLDCQKNIGKKNKEVPSFFARRAYRVQKNIANVWSLPSPNRPLCQTHSGEKKVGKNKGSHPDWAWVLEGKPCEKDGNQSSRTRLRGEKEAVMVKQKIRGSVESTCPRSSSSKEKGNTAAIFWTGFRTSVGKKNNKNRKN